LRWRQVKAAAREAREQQVALGAEEFRHLTPGIRMTLQVERDRLLQRSGDAEGVELVHLAQLAREHRGRHAVTHAPAGDVQGLAERIHREAA
jgi:hypothetical protein